MTEWTVSSKVPPHNLEAEISVLGSMLLDNDTIEQVATLCPPERFYATRHQIIAEHIYQLWASNHPVELVGLKEALTQSQKLDDVGGISYLVGLGEQVPTAVYAEFYANIIVEKWEKRELIRSAGKIMEAAFDGSLAHPDLLEYASKSIHMATQGLAVDEDDSMDAIIDEAVEEIFSLETKGVPTGFIAIDAKTGGLYPGTMNVIAARPSMGKSAWAGQIADNVARHTHGTVLVISQEMPSKSYAKRIIMANARVNQHRASEMKRLKDPRLLTQMDRQKIRLQANRLKESGVLVKDWASFTFEEIIRKVRRLAKRSAARGKPLTAVVIDYLQLLQMSKKKHSGENRQQEISQISRAIKLLARELDIPFVVLSQLSRAVEQRPNHRPMLSDLKESGAIEQDSDLVMFIYRDEYYNKQTDQQGVAEIIIAKHREGSTGTEKLNWHADHVRFSDREDDAYLKQTSLFTAKGP